MKIEERLKENADTINRINGLLDEQHQTLFSEYCKRFKAIGNLLESTKAKKDDAAVKTEWTERLDKWKKRTKKEPQKQVVPVVDYQELKTRRQELEKQLEQVAEQLEQHKFDDFDKAVKSLLSDGVTKDELINRINAEQPEPRQTN